MTTSHLSPFTVNTDGSDATTAYRPAAGQITTQGAEIESTEAQDASSAALSPLIPSGSHSDDFLE